MYTLSLFFTNPIEPVIQKKRVFFSILSKFTKRLAGLQGKIGGVGLYKKSQAYCNTPSIGGCCFLPDLAGLSNI
jgi:hypothetical protein